MSYNKLIQVYRVYPNDKQKKIIENTFNACKEMHNLILKERAYVYNKFIVYASRCYINKIKIDEDRFLSKNVTQADFKNINKRYENIDSIAVNNEQISVINAYDRYFSGNGAFPSLKKVNKYNTSNVNNDIKIEKNYIKLPCLGELKTNGENHLPNNMKVDKATVECNKKGEYYITFVLKNKKKSVKAKPTCYIH